QAADAHPDLAEALRAAGARVTIAKVYRSVPLKQVDPAPLERADLVCFFAPSQVQAFRALSVTTAARFWGHGPTTRAAMVGMPQVDDLP
ncbi:MAG: uroporphyrinogen-III synthase, partial [Planctomycetota bacterium]